MNKMSESHSIIIHCFGRLFEPLNICRLFFLKCYEGVKMLHLC